MFLQNDFHMAISSHALLSAGTAKRLLMACAMGGIVGAERESRHKACGLRTNMLLCVGCAFFTLLSAVIAGDSTPNKGQVAANIVQGIGFLGAGLILHNRSKVLGLTSAATVFVVASIGMACGAGLYLEAALATLIVLFALWIVGSFEGMSGWKRYAIIYEIRGKDRVAMDTAVLRVLDPAGYHLNIHHQDVVAGLERVTFSITANKRRHKSLLAELRESDGTDEVFAFRDVDED